MSRDHVARFLARARQEADDAIAAGLPPRDLLQRLASEDPVALAEVVVGPRAPASPLLVAAALEVLPALEAAISPKALYQRLVALAAETRLDVLAIAAERHPLASWLLGLSAKVEGDLAGLRHLAGAASHPAFARVCQLYAEAGHTAGMVAVAAELARPELAAQLAAAGHLDAAAEAVVRTLERQPASPVVAWVAAGWGPEVERLLLGCVRYLRDGDTAAALAPWLDGQTRAMALLAAVRPALPAARAG